MDFSNSEKVNAVLDGEGKSGMICAAFHSTSCYHSSFIAFIGIILLLLRRKLQLEWNNYCKLLFGVSHTAPLYSGVFTCRYIILEYYYFDMFNIIYSLYYLKGSIIFFYYIILKYLIVLIYFRKLKNKFYN